MGHTIVKTCCAEGAVPPTALGGVKRRARFRMCHCEVRELQTRFECDDGVKMLQAPSSMMQVVKRVMQVCSKLSPSRLNEAHHRQDVLCRGCGSAHSARGLSAKNASECASAMCGSFKHGSNVPMVSRCCKRRQA